MSEGADLRHPICSGREGSLGARELSETNLGGLLEGRGWNALTLLNQARGFSLAISWPGGDRISLSTPKQGLPFVD